MTKVFPDYYKDFKCIADKCLHNCCIGWEIDIDGKSLELYEKTEGEIGKRLSKSISCEDTPHFILDENERCPFLNENNLCDIITSLGEEAICEICTMHPRFVNYYEERTEFGLGLCCEEAARIILSKKDKTVLLADGEDTDDILISRDALIEVFTDRKRPFSERRKRALALCGSDYKFDPNLWFDRLFELERLDEAWSELISEAKNTKNFLAENEFETETEQLTVYFLYRHGGNACDLEDLAKRTAFACLCVDIIRSCWAAQREKYGKLDFERMCDIARLFSAEIEYSEENTETILSLL